MQRLLLITLLLVSPTAFAYDWQTPLMWDWVLSTANPKLNEHESEITTLQSQLATQAPQIAALQADLATAVAYIDDLQNYVSVDDTTDPTRPVVMVSGANLQVVNGLGSTPTVNGVGNIIVGYDENMGFLCTVIETGPEIYDDVQCFNQGGFPLSVSALKTGSHNIVVGDRHTYTSFAGIVGGTANFIRGKGASITGGHYNYADGNWSHVSGGELNNAKASRSTITGGSVNTVEAGARDGSISGGTSNTIQGTSRNGSISGGSATIVTGNDDWRAGSLFEDN